MRYCPSCGKMLLHDDTRPVSAGAIYHYKCTGCDESWEEDRSIIYPNPINLRQVYSHVDSREEESSLVS